MKTSTALMAFTTLAIHILLLMTAFSLNEQRIASLQSEGSSNYLGIFTSHTAN
jgi:hypothetical protein